MNDHSRRVYDSILGLLPDVDNPTPLVRLSHTVPFEHAEVYAKLEWYNPFGAVKDRVAASMLRDAEERGVIGGEQSLVEPTSGNTGIGLAMLSNVAGRRLSTPMSREVPLEKRTMLRLFGAEVIELDDTLCPAPWEPEGAIATARQMAEEPGYAMLNQYANPANPDAHYRTTGPEIWHQTDGRVTHFVAGLGTCGTITGTGRFLKEQNAGVAVLGVYPEEGHSIPGVRSLPQLDQTDFFYPDEYDGLVEVNSRVAFDLCVRLNREESVTAGPSSGMALAGALELVPDVPGTMAVVVFPDSAFKYASSFGAHIPGLVPDDTAAVEVARDELFTRIIENTRVHPAMTIDVGPAHERWSRSSPVLVDVRSKELFDALHIPGAVNIPLEELPDRVSELPDDKDVELLSVCQRGNISLPGVLFMASLGYRNARSLTGGTDAWAAAGLPVEGSRAPVSAG